MTKITKKQEREYKDFIFECSKYGVTIKDLCDAYKISLKYECPFCSIANELEWVTCQASGNLGWDATNDPTSTMEFVEWLFEQEKTIPNCSMLFQTLPLSEIEKLEKNPPKQVPIRTQIDNVLKTWGKL